MVIYINHYSGRFQQYPLNLTNLRKLSLKGLVHTDEYLHEMASISQELKSINLISIHDTMKALAAINHFANYQHITHLQVRNCLINSEHLERIAQNAPNLVEVHLDLKHTIDLDFRAIIRLMNGCEQLTTLEIRTKKARMLHFDCEMLHELVEVIGRRTKESTKKVTIYGRENLNVKFPTDHLDIYRDQLKVENYFPRSY